MTALSKWVQALGSENAFKIGPKIRSVEEQGKKVIKCNLGEPDFPLPTFIKDEVKRQIDLDNTHYCDPQGILPLRRAVAACFESTRKIPSDPARVVVFPGAKPPIGFSQMVYCRPGDEVIYPSPGFPIYESFIASVGARPVPIHLRGDSDQDLAGSMARQRRKTKAASGAVLSVAGGCAPVGEPCRRRWRRPAVT